MSKEFKNLYRQGSAMNKLFGAMARAGKPLPMHEIAKRAGVPIKRAQVLVCAMRNPFHNSSLRRAGIEVSLEKDGYSLAACAVDPKAHRLAAKKAGKAKSSAKKPTKKSSKPVAKKKQKPASKADEPQNPGCTTPADAARSEGSAPAAAGTKA